MDDDHAGRRTGSRDALPPRAFRNWAGTVRTSPDRWLEPRDEDELAQAVRDAQGRRIKVVGSGHSFSPIAAPQDTAVGVGALTGVRRFEHDRVVVGAGTRLRDLNSALDDHGLAMPILGSITEQTVAGAVATATHGSSLVHGNLSSLVEGVRLVDGGGKVLAVDADDPRLDGLRVHLGALGVLTEVTLRVAPRFRLAATVEAVPAATLSRELAAIAASAEYAKVWWLPGAPYAAVTRWSRTTEGTSFPHPRWRRRVEDNLHTWLFPSLLTLSRARPLFGPLRRAVARSFLHSRCVGPSALMLTTAMPTRHRETEAAVPMGHAGEALERISRRVERDRLSVNFPLELRFVRGDTSWLSPAHGTDSCQIGAYHRGTGSDAYFAAFWDEMRPLAGRPHWGKETPHDAAAVADLWPLLDKFTELRDELDPARTFANDFLDRLLGP